ncbi:MAG TPA: hypothetical protein VFU93_11600 [Acidimicrobiales bacterium]|nr:hypothetical protein [Acidimicrobiales bacterium]
MPTLVTPRGVRQVEDLWLDSAALDAATGWQLKPEGLCRDDACLIVPEELRHHDRVDVAGLWTRLGRPVLTSGDAVYLGEDASSKPALQAGAMAPDFTLRDLAGIEHSLSDHRGKKVFISSWAPW